MSFLGGLLNQMCSIQTCSQLIERNPCEAHHDLNHNLDHDRFKMYEVIKSSNASSYGKSQPMSGHH